MVQLAVQVVLMLAVRQVVVRRELLLVRVLEVLAVLLQGKSLLSQQMALDMHQMAQMITDISINTNEVKDITSMIAEIAMNITMMIN
ncbi:hypothetical protein GALL_20080 [mine drainage metagenome]|uniref:Uncharacterized protein n=1 Tax=mine drainage metagenome TaxID=410659 RepID=A0A1J5TA93_9ZZZZ